MKKRFFINLSDEPIAEIMDIHHVDVIIEKGDDNTFSAYLSEDSTLPFGILGDGDTVDEAIEDFELCFKEMQAHYKEVGDDFPKAVEFSYRYDLASFLSYYSKILSFAGLEKLTGVNQGQLSHYVTGRRKPSKKTVNKIESKLHSFAKEISEVSFV